MELYLKNYWLLNLEFIEAFSEVSYRKIPLPLLSNFYHYLNDGIKAKMESAPLYDSVETFRKGDIQPSFDNWLSPIRKPVQSPTGKLLMNFDYLRFLPENYKYFSPEQTLILTRWEAKEVYSIPALSKNSYNKQLNCNPIIQKAEELFRLYEHHFAFGNKNFQAKFLADLPLMIQNIEMCIDIFRQEKISAVLVGTTEELTSRVLAIVSSMFGIPSYCLQHGLILGEEAYLPAFATDYLVYGQFEKDWYLQRGVKQEQIHIAGHPRYDGIFTSQHINKFAICKKLRLNPAKKTVLLATQPNNTNFYVELTKLLVTNPNIQVIIKPHPWEKAKNRTGEYIQLERKYSQVKYVTNEVPLYSLINCTDVVVVANSTVGLEALLMDKPVVVYKSPTENRDYPYFNELGSFVVSNSAEVKEMVQYIMAYRSAQLKAKKVREEFVAKNYPIQRSIPHIKKIIQQT